MRRSGRNHCRLPWRSLPTLWLAMAVTPLTLPADSSWAAQQDSATGSRVPVIATAGSQSSWSVAIHPLAEATAREGWLRNLVQGSLVILDENWNWQCQLCVALPSTSNGLLRAAPPEPNAPRNARRSIIVDFEIPANATWGDGTPLTGRDFQLGNQIARAMPATTRSGNAARAVDDVSLDPKNNKRFSVRLKEAVGDFWFASAMRPVPAHLEAEVWTSSEGIYKDYLQSTTYATDPWKPGLYSGPWTPKPGKPGIRLEANAGFAAGKAATPVMLVAFHGDERTAVAAVEAGNADLIPETDLSASSANKITRKDTVRFALGTELEHLDFNTRNPLLTDVNLRRAISLIINRHELARATGFPVVLPMATGILHPAMTGTPARLDRGEILDVSAVQHPVWGHAPSEAFAILQQTGWTRDETGKASGVATWKKEGVPLELEIESNHFDTTRSAIVRSIAKQLTDAGIKVTVRDGKSDVFLRDTVRKLKFRYLAAYAWRMPAAVVPASILDSRQIPTLQNAYTGENTAGWSNKALDEILEKSRQEWDPTLRRDMLAQIENLATADVPFIPLFYRPVVAAASAGLHGFKLPGHDGWSSSLAREWTLLDPK